MKKILLGILTFLLSITTINAEVITEFSFILNENNKMITYGTINDISGYYIIDTGATDIVLFAPVQNIPVIQAEYNNFRMLGTSFDTSRYVITKLQLGDTELVGEFTLIQPPEEIRSLFSPEIKGIINITAFNKYFVEISFSEKKIKLHENMPAGYTTYCSYVMDGLLPYISIPINDSSYTFLIDTGDFFTIRFPEKLLNTIHTTDIFEVSVWEHNIQSHYNNYYIFKNHDFSLFGHVYNKVICQTSVHSDKETEGTIGLNILKNYNVVFDFESNRLYYKPLLPDTFYNIFFTNQAHTSGMLSHIYGDNCLIIEEIIVGSPMWKRGLRAGSLITKVNSFDCIGISRSYLTRTFQSNNRVRIEYIDSENRRRTVRVRPKTLID